jgi:hypothetical protein
MHPKARFSFGLKPLKLADEPAFPQFRHISDKSRIPLCKTLPMLNHSTKKWLRRNKGGASLGENATNGLPSMHTVSLSKKLRHT